ncbi:MAG: PRC-barrel domain-containing protein [Melioribacteraceae bacterium]
MLHKVKALKGYGLNSHNGEIGKVLEFYFDDKHWTIRYLVADAGNWLTGRQVLISPYSIMRVNEKEEQIQIDLTKKQIVDSPTLDSDKPVSRQYETDYYGYFGWPLYWDGPNTWGYFPDIVRDSKKWSDVKSGEDSWDPNLRSTHEVTGYNIEAADGDIGHVVDFIIDDESWTIRYLIVDTRNWLPGKKIILSPFWIDRVSWGEAKVFVNLTMEQIKESPEYSDDLLLTRDYETGLHKHYNRKAYWVDAHKDRVHIL